MGWWLISQSQHPEANGRIQEQKRGNIIPSVNWQLHVGEKKIFVDVRGQSSARAECSETIWKATGSQRTTVCKQIAQNSSVLCDTTNRLNKPLKNDDTAPDYTTAHALRQSRRTSGAVHNLQRAEPDFGFQSNYDPSGLLRPMRSFVRRDAQQPSQYTQRLFYSRALRVMKL